MADKKRTALGKMNKLEYIQEYTRENYDRIGLTCPKGTKQLFKKEADARGLSVSAFVVRAVEDFISK